MPEKRPRSAPTRSKKTKTTSMVKVEQRLPEALEPVAGRDLRLFALAVGRLSANTRTAYAQDIKRFGVWWGQEEPIVKLISLSAGEAREVVLNYQGSMLSRGLSKNTAARAIRSLNSIIKKLHFAEKVTWTLDVPTGKVQIYKDVRGPGTKAWHKLIKHVVAQPQWTAVRDVAVFRLLGNDGLRAGEIGKLIYPDHVRQGEENGTTYVEVYVQGKGDKDGWHPIHPKTWAAILQWLEVRVERMDNEHGPLFCSQRGKPLSGHCVWQRVTYHAKSIGLDIHPHELRHHAITVRARQWTGPHSALVRWARHEDPRTTQVYVDDVSDQSRQIAALGDED